MSGIFRVGVLPSGAGMARAYCARTTGYHRGHRRCRVTVWFTVKLDDRPGSLARVATALGERGVNITGIVGVAEDTDGALMLTTSDAAATREAFAALGLPYEEHDPDSGPDIEAFSEVQRGLADRGMNVAR